MAQHTRYWLYGGILSVFLASCSQIPKEAYYDRGAPEGLLDMSSEVVDLKVDSPASVQEITNWINQDQPTRAELSCPDGDAACVRVRHVLHQFGVPVKYTSSAEGNVTLVYERVLARDCENRYIDNPVNPYNFQHPTFGCTTAVNMVQMVSDKRQFTSPALLDGYSGVKAVQAMGFYQTPSNFSPNSASADLQTLGGGVSSR